MFSWILALLLAVVVWSLAAAYFWLVKRRRKETRLGLNALAGMHWRDFSEIVRRALHEQRGLQDITGEPDHSLEPSSDFLMQDEKHQRYLVSCKHGRAYRIGTAAVNELGAAARLAGARGGILITEGRIERDGRATADKQSVEVLDGTLLWPMLQPYLPGDVESRVKNEARREAVRRISIAALGSLTLGLIVGMGYLTSRLDQGETPTATAPAGTTTLRRLRRMRRRRWPQRARLPGRRLKSLRRSPRATTPTASSALWPIRTQRRWRVTSANSPRWWASRPACSMRSGRPGRRWR